MNSVFRAQLNSNRWFICKYLEIDELLMYMSSIFTDSMLDQIRSKRTRYERASEMLTILTRRGPNAEQTFLDALYMTNQEFMIDFIRSETSTVLYGFLNPRFERFLKTHYGFLVQYLDVDSVIPHLVEHLSFYLIDLIKSKPTKTQRTECLIDILSRKPKQIERVFVSALRETKQDHIVEAMTKE